MSERILVQVRLPRNLVKQLDHLAIDYGLTRTQLVQILLEQALDRRDAKYTFSLKVLP